MISKEARARIKINILLEKAGWLLLDDGDKKANVLLENRTKIVSTELGDNFEKTHNGFIDFLLIGKDGKALAVLEAKAEHKSPLSGKEQSREYAQSINCRFVILSNGNTHYFWDLEQGNPEEITSFPTPEALEAYFSFKPDIDALVNEAVTEDFIAENQYPKFRHHPDFKNEHTRAAFLRDNKVRILRDYQVKATQSVQNAIAEGKIKFLFEMATGTGKTLTSAAIIKLFLKTENAKRVLFLVDRLELETQAEGDLSTHLKNSGYKISIFKQDKDNWKRSDIVISTVQSFNNGKYRQIFKPDDFDLLISDEAHRSITGNYREVFEYFVGFKLGLTATPKNYLKNFKDAPQNDERELERRTLLDTYKTFGCAGGEPTFRYGLLDGVKDKILINPRVIEIKTDITTQLLSEEGYSIKSLISNPDPLVNEDMEIEERFGKRDFEKKFFSPSTNIEFCKVFLQKALRDPVTGEMGKTILFCVRQSHAAEITKILNELANQIWQGKYKSDFAVQITSEVKEAQDKTTKFKNNQLLGNANFDPEYKTSKARVCVTVGMMTTGYDCEDILNIGLMRPIFSPSEFVQIKGRGTRKHNFSSNCQSKALKEEYADTNKEMFLLFDYFANCTYFEEEFNYDEVIKLPKPKAAELTLSDAQQAGDTITEMLPHTNLSPDEVKSIKEIIIGTEGMKIDRMFINFEEEIAQNPFIAEKVHAGDFEAAEQYIEAHYINKPSEFYTLDKLNKSLRHYEANLGRKISLKEMLKKTFGIISEYKSKDELSDEAFTDFTKAIAEQDNINQTSLEYFYKALLENKAIRDKIEQKDFAFLHGGDAENLGSMLNAEQFKAIPLELRNKVMEHINRNQKYIELLN